MHYRGISLDWGEYLRSIPLIYAGASLPLLNQGRLAERETLFYNAGCALEGLKDLTPDKPYEYLQDALQQLHMVGHQSPIHVVDRA